MTAPTTLFAVIEAGDLDGLTKLLEQGADVNALKPTPPHWSPLHEAIETLEEGGPIEALMLLLRRGANVEGGGGDTPLLMALYRTQPQAVTLLLAAGANPNVRGPEGDSPLRLCVERGDLATAATLLRCGAYIGIDEAGGPLGASALGLASRRLDLRFMSLLLDWGAQPTVLDADHMTARDRLAARCEENSDAYDRAVALLDGNLSRSDTG